MKVGIIGSGGREHAICYEINKSNKVDEIYCFPGNGGTHLLAKNVDLDLENFELLKNFIQLPKLLFLNILWYVN